ncbi:MAG: RNA-binding protein [Gammaproteobacteria bacterium RBG_16_57_12]|nr:MAG: RNA-binding protein [Gammaproteobacteria bacterium RBG_16_57_12]
MQLTSKAIRFLRSMAHTLKPVVIIGGNGITAGVIKELDSALAHHELIKIKVNAGDRAARQAMIEDLCAQTAAAHVQSIGHIAVLYRPAKKPVITLPSASAN